jgi:hypothetical protein
MEKKHVERLSQLYRRARDAGDPAMTSLVEHAIKDLLAAEAAITSAMVAESIAISSLGVE